MLKFRTSARSGIAGIVVTAAVTLGSCGGGSSGGNTAAQPTTPRFTSSTTSAVSENLADPFYTATASDPQNDPITFSIQGGVDAGNFVFGSNGALRFDVAPNFDLPRDANMDNIYEVILRASAGGENVDLNLRVEVQNSKEGISVKRIATGLAEPVSITSLFSGQRLLVLEKSGRVVEIDGASGALKERDDIEAGLLPGQFISMAYAGHNKPYIQGVYFLSHSPSLGLLLQIFNPGNGKFNSKVIGTPSAEAVTGKLFRGSGGHIFAAIGDPGGTRAQDDLSGYGKLWSTFGYDPYAGASLPPNPAVLVSKIGSGIGNPGGGSSAYDFNLLADRGATKEEEITFFKADWRPLDFGWPFYEGYAEVKTSPPPQVNGPTLTYKRGAGPREGKGIVSGWLYLGSISSIHNHYVFGDIDGKVWSISFPKLNDGSRHAANDLELRTLDFVPNEGTIDSPVAFELTPDNILYILDSDGEVFRVDPV